MNAPPSYGRLIGEAAGALVGVSSLVEVGFRDSAQALDALAEWTRYTALLDRHLGFLASLHPGNPRPARRPIPATAPCRDRHPAASSLAASGLLVGAAHDVLASHFGPERQHRTPAAELIEATAPTSRALADIADLQLSAGVGHAALTRRALQVAQPGDGVAPVAARVAREAGHVLGAAARLRDRVTCDAAAATHGPDPLAVVTTAPTLTAATVEPDPGDPGARLAAVLARLRLAAYRQARGELSAGASSVRALAWVGQLLCTAEAASASRPGHARRWAQAGRSWSALGKSWSRVRTLTAGPRALTYDAAAATDLIAHRPAGQPATVDNAAGGTHPAMQWLDTVSVDLDRTYRSLAGGGLLLVPSRPDDTTKGPSLWAPAEPHHLRDLADRHRAVVRNTATAAAPDTRAAGGAVRDRRQVWRSPSRREALTLPVPPTAVAEVS